MEKKLRAILYLDDSSRLKIKTNISEIGLYGISFINNFSELTDELLNETKTLIILEGYFNKANSISDLILYKEIFDLNIYCLGNIENYKGHLEGVSSVYYCDITLLDFDMIQAAIYKDKSLAKETESSSMDAVTVANTDLARKILKDTVNYNSKLHALANEYLSLRDTLNIVSEAKDIAVENLRISDTKILKLEKENGRLLAGYSDILKNTIALNKSLLEYESVLTKDVYEKLDLNSFTNRPLVIYFKEFEDLLYLDTFIETLYYVFINQYHKSVKVVRLYDSAKTRKLSVVPDYYHRIYNKFITEELVVNNFLCKSGDYKKMLDILLTNNSNLDILLLFDHKDLNDYVLSGSYLQFNICRSYHNLEAYGIKKENTIVNFNEENEDAISWNYYPELSEIKSKEERFLFLSSRPAIGKIYALSKFYAESV